MDLEIIVVNEVSQTEKDECHMNSLYVESKKQDKETSKIETHR